jgi:DNA-binding response OmpR family regulator
VGLAEFVALALVYVYVGFRKKLGEDRIVTVRGMGYQLRAAKC